MARKYMFLVIFTICSVNCETSGNSTEQPVQDTSLRKSREIGSYIGLVTCAMNYDVSCFVNAAEDYLEVQRTELLAEADEQALHSTGRSDPDSKPSHLANTLGHLISQLTNMFRNGMSGFFTYGREAVDDEDDEDDSEVEENELADATTNDSNGEMRSITSTKKKKKKDKKPLKSLIRLARVALIGLIIVFKLAILLKFLQTAMQFKFLLISLGGFAIQAAKFWMTIKNKKDHDHEEIVYKNPYSSHDEYSSPGGGAPYGGEYNAARSAQDLAYSLQKPL